MSLVAPLARIAVEGGRVARSQPVVTLLVAGICAAVSLTTLATTGRSVGAERAVLARIDDAGTSLITVIDSGGDAGIDVTAIDRLQSLGNVEWAVGIGPVDDVRPIGLSGADAVPARHVAGGSPELELSRAPGDQPVALVDAAAMTALGYTAPAGAVQNAEGEQVPLAGVFSAGPTLATLRSGVLLVHSDWEGPLRSIVIQVDRPENVLSTADAVRSVLASANPESVRIDVAADLALVRSAVQGELGGYGRAIVLQALVAGLALAAATIYGGINGRRRDFGRRRALGASRRQLVGVVVAQTLTGALPGTILGAVVGSGVAWRLAGTWPGWAFPSAIAVLTLIAVSLAALIPAAAAALRDPVQALRVP